MALDVDKKELTVGRNLAFPSKIWDRIDEIEDWISQGVAEYSIIKMLGIAKNTWYAAKRENKEFLNRINRARGSAAELLLHKQYQAASGHVVTLKKDKVTKDGDIIPATEEIYIPPNVNAADFWARHMMPGYIAPRSEGQAVTVTVQLPAVEAELQRISSERERLERELQALPDIVIEQASRDDQVASRDDDAPPATPAQERSSSDERDPFA